MKHKFKLILLAFVSPIGVFLIAEKQNINVKKVIIKIDAIKKFFLLIKSIYPSKNVDNYT